MGGKGGARPGAGRPKGVTHANSIAVSRRLQHDGKILPLEVLVTTMRNHWADYLQTTEALVSGKLDEKDVERTKELRLFSAQQACLYAEKAAPYIHSKLSAIEVKGDVTHQTVARVPEVSPSMEAWEKTYAPAVSKDLH